MSDLIFSVRGHIRVEGAASNPTVNDDSTKFFAEGSIWVNTTTNTSYVCLDAAAGAAVWKSISNSDVLTTRGDIIRRNATVPERLALGASKTALVSDGTDAGWGYQIANFTAADDAILWLPIVTNPQTAAVSVTPVSTLNSTRVKRIRILERFKVTNIYVQLRAKQASSHFGWGLYADTSSAALFTTGAIDTSVTEAVIKVTLGSPYTIEPGAYWVAWTADQSATLRVSGLQEGGFFETMQKDTVNLSGVGANASVAGVLPATIGNVTAEANGTFPVVALRP